MAKFDYRRQLKDLSLTQLQYRKGKIQSCILSALGCLNRNDADKYTRYSIYIDQEISRRGGCINEK